MLVDDQAFNINALKMMLKRLKLDEKIYNNVANNGREAVDMIRNDIRINGQSSFKLVFMDCQMPIMDGYEATQKIKELSESTRVVAISGNTEKTQIQKALDEGMQEFYPKPVKVDQLARELHSSGFIAE